MDKFVVIVALMVGSYVFINLLYFINNLILDIRRIKKSDVDRRPLTDAESMAQLNMSIAEWGSFGGSKGRNRRKWYDEE